ncbi:MAG: hypothetical protein H7335_02095 [Massilia sp.]|nr:hypothetical protein [Massilia sp.]
MPKLINPLTDNHFRNAKPTLLDIQMSNLATLRPCSRWHDLNRNRSLKIVDRVAVKPLLPRAAQRCGP